MPIAWALSSRTSSMVVPVRGHTGRRSTQEENFGLDSLVIERPDHLEEAVLIAVDDEQKSDVESASNPDDHTIQIGIDPTTFLEFQTQHSWPAA